MLKKFILLTGLLTCILWQSAEAGGGWPQRKGKIYLKLSGWWVVADQHFTSSGMIDPNLTRANYITSLYAEYGITNRLTGIVYFPFFSRAVVNEQLSGTTGDVILEGDAINSVGDTDIQLKYGLFQNGSVKVSTSLTLGLPTGISSGGRDGSLQTGDGEFNQIVSVDISRSFPIRKLNTYGTISLGFNNRTEGFSDEFRYLIEGGVTFGKWIAILRLNGVQSLMNGDDNFDSNGTSLFGNNVSFNAFSPEVGFKMTEKVGISASYSTAFSGELIFARPSFSVGIFANL
jgi:hypothetical protein